LSKSTSYFLYIIQKNLRIFNAHKITYFSAVSFPSATRTKEIGYLVCWRYKKLLEAALAGDRLQFLSITKEMEKKS
jgi:hypothetical protein